MEMKGTTVLLLGGAGLVGVSVARRLLEFAPRRLAVASLREEEAREAVAELAGLPGASQVELIPIWGDLFVPAEMWRLTREEILASEQHRQLFLDDLYGELTEPVFLRSALGKLLLDLRPDLVVDSVNTAGVLAYQNVFASAAGLREAAHAGGVGSDLAERHLATLYLPQLIRHVQVALEGMKRASTRMYVKIGTAGTGGMGLNIPFTHSEERPSRVLLAKAGLAGAHSLLLYLMARTPDSPAVKEIKPTAAISWKSMGQGVIRRGGRPILRGDALRPLPAAEAFPTDSGSPLTDSHGNPAWAELHEPLEGVFLDAGENGLFSPMEFETLTALGLMEYVTPEEIAENVVREIQGHPTGRDVVSALDAATMGPTYRAGVLRSQALKHLEIMEAKAGVEGVAFEMLGPPRLSKLLFEGTLLRHLYSDVSGALASEPQEVAAASLDFITSNPDFRQRIVTIGLPILLPDGESVLRGPRVKVPPLPGRSVVDPGVVDSGWVDLRAENWARWQQRLRDLQAEVEARPGLGEGSGGDHEYGDGDGSIRPGRLAAWIFRTEDRGARIKR